MTGACTVAAVESAVAVAAGARCGVVEIDEPIRRRWWEWLLRRPVRYRRIVRVVIGADREATALDLAAVEQALRATMAAGITWRVEWIANGVRQDLTAARRP